MHKATKASSAPLSSEQKNAKSGFHFGLREVQTLARRFSIFDEFGTSYGNLMLDNLIQLILKHSASQADPNIINLELLEAAWPALVGREMARRTRPRAWSEGTLHIDVSTHAWVQELSFHREELLGRIQRLFPWQLDRLHLSVPEPFEPLELREELELYERPEEAARYAKSARSDKPLGEQQEKEVDEALEHLDEETRAHLLSIRRHIKGSD